MTAIDGGVGDSGGDAGTGRDAGPDGGMTMTDAGPEGCTEDCELVELALGLEHTCVRRASGEVRCWGANRFGQLGDGNTRHTMDCTFAEETDPVDCAPPVTTAITNAHQISSEGSFSSCALTDEGEVWCWGYQGVAETTGAELDKRYSPEMMALAAAATDISDGWQTTCAVVSGEVWCLTSNGAGQAADGTTTEVSEPQKVEGLSGIVDVEVSQWGSFVCARSATETWCWGSNEHGELGDGVTDHSMCMRGGTSGFYDCAKMPAPVTPLNDLADPVTQLSLGGNHACALTSAGTVYCWGQGIIGQLGQADDSYAGSHTPLMVPGITNAVQVAAGGVHTCVRLDTGAIRCWGAHDEGQLGDGVAVNGHDGVCTVGSSSLDCTDTPVDVATIDDATFLEAGDSHTCAIRGMSEVWCWGLNSRIQLGIGGTGPESRERRVEPTAVTGIDDY